MRANITLIGVLLVALLFNACSAFPSRPDDRALAYNEKYQLLKEILPALREIAEERFVEDKRNQEVMTAFNKVKEIKDMLRSG
ncbi:unnamed protein product [Tenebrio molitor]|jgi:hypothetical protein|nr:unnamed protein product [Tenebrio molitor]